MAETNSHLQQDAKSLILHQGSQINSLGFLQPWPLPVQPTLSYKCPTSSVFVQIQTGSAISPIFPHILRGFTFSRLRKGNPGHYGVSTLFCNTLNHSWTLSDKNIGIGTFMLIKTTKFIMIQTEYSLFLEYPWLLGAGRYLHLSEFWNNCINIMLALFTVTHTRVCWALTFFYNLCTGKNHKAD